MNIVKHPDHTDLTEWLDADFDPEAFDLDAANRALARLHPRRARRPGSRR